MFNKRRDISPQRSKRDTPIATMIEMAAATVTDPLGFQIDLSPNAFCKPPPVILLVSGARYHEREWIGGLETRLV
jgi:hypothetical protein